MASIGVPELVVVLAICAGLLVVIWPAARICRRVGYPSWLGVLSIVPVANVMLMWFVALAEWPSARQAGR